MGLRKVFFGCAVLIVGGAVAVAARAQVGVYGMVTGQRFGGITCPSFAAPCASNNGDIRPYGGTFGAYYDFKSYGPVRLGVDARGDVLTSNKSADSSAGGRGVVRQYAVLGGLRGSFHTPFHWLRPYAEIAGGYGRNNASGQYTITDIPNTSLSSLSYNPALYTNYTMVKGFVGVDVPLLPFLDLRAIEVGVGEAFGSSATVLTVSAPGATPVVQTNSLDTHGLESIGAGIVLHLPR